MAITTVAPRLIASASAAAAIFFAALSVNTGLTGNSARTVVTVAASIKVIAKL
jgi:hypothetical protein